MASEIENDQLGNDESGGSSRALLIGAIFAAGAGVGLGIKTLLDKRRGGPADDMPSGQAGGGEGADGDLPTVLRRAALDVALAATSRAAERLDSGGDRESSADEHAVEQPS